jgi:urea transport system permease protein
VIAAALVQFQLSDPDPAAAAGADALERDAEASHLSALQGLQSNPKPIRCIKARKERLQLLLTIQFGTDQANRVLPSKVLPAIPASMCARRSIRCLRPRGWRLFDARPKVSTSPGADAGQRHRDQVAYQMLVDAGKAPPVVPMATASRR